MNGPHDLGGAQGFGSVPMEGADEVFHEDWERRVFGISFALWGRIGTADDFRYARERMDHAEYLAASYYEKWLAAAERLLVERGVITADELEAKRRELEADPDAPLPERTDPALRERLLRLAYEGDPATRPVDRAPRFAVGDRVRARNVHPLGHTRLPRYVRGRSGVVDEVLDSFFLPDARAAGRGDEPQHCYSVRFDGRELWGDSAEPNSTVCLHLWESYLEEDAA